MELRGTWAMAEPGLGRETIARKGPGMAGPSRNKVATDDGKGPQEGSMGKEAEPPSESVQEEVKS